MGGDKDVLDKTPETREKEQLKAQDKLTADAQVNREVQISAGDLSKYNVTHLRQGDKTDFTTVNDYPNGVKVTREEAPGVLKPHGGIGLEAPPGGTVVENKDGTKTVKDASGKIVGKMDPDKTLHVYTKHGEFVETADGKVSFKSSDGTTSWDSLHKAGAVPASKFEDYGMARHGNVTRFPNGIDYDRASNNIKIPTEHGQNFRVDKEYDDKGNVIKATGYGADGKVLYSQDAKGLHVPTADGVLTQKADGSVSFESNKAATGSGSLPKVDIGDSKQTTGGKHKETPEEALARCRDSSDPLCGIEDDLDADERAIERNRQKKK